MKYVQRRMFHVTLTMIKWSCRCYWSRLRSKKNWEENCSKNWSKIKKNKYINFRDHQDSAVDIVVDTGSLVITEMDERPISGRGHRPCFNCFLLNVQWLNEINQYVTLLKIRSYAHLKTRVFLKTSTILNHSLIWAKNCF